MQISWQENMHLMYISPDIMAMLSCKVSIDVTDFFIHYYHFLNILVIFELFRISFGVRASVIYLLNFIKEEKIVEIMNVKLDINQYIMDFFFLWIRCIINENWFKIELSKEEIVENKRLSRIKYQKIIFMINVRYHHISGNKTHIKY